MRPLDVEDLQTLKYAVEDVRKLNSLLTDIGLSVYQLTITTDDGESEFGKIAWDAATEGFAFHG